jgi:hypothetical protein
MKKITDLFCKSIVAIVFDGESLKNTGLALVCNERLTWIGDCIAVAL